jgi:opacity protein-like surface antigen
MVQPEVHFRQYSGINTAFPNIMGPNTRDDVIFAVIAGVHYNFRSWFLATLNYRFSTVQTDYMYTIDGQTDDPSFARHELLAGVRVAL